MSVLNRERVATPGGPLPVRKLAPTARRRRGRAPRAVAYLYLLPGFAVFTLFVLVPLGHTVWLSFFQWDGVTLGEWVGLANYRQEFSDPVARDAFKHSLLLIIFFSILPVAIGLLLAAVLSRSKLRGLTFFRTVLFLPQVVTMVVIGVTWRWMFDQDGTVNQVLRALGLGGLSRAWLGDFTWALPAIGLIGTWVMFGLCMVLFLAGIGTIDPDLYEAARVDGAGFFREFLAVTVPGLRQEISVALTITMIAALRSFDVVYVTSGGGPGTASNVPGFEIYRLAFREGAVGRACTVAVILTALIFLVVMIVQRVLRDDR